MLIENLVKLQSIDLDRARLNQELRALPAEIAQSQARLAAAQRQSADASAALSREETLRASLDREISALRKKAARYRAQQDSLTTPEQATAVFRIFQETLTNVARHANASAVDVRLANVNENLTLEVHDNGRGIPKEKHSSGGSFGILGMRERALLLGGEVTITGPPGSGTTVRVRIPIVPSDLAGIARQGLLFSPNGREGRESE